MCQSRIKANGFLLVLFSLLGLGAYAQTSSTSNPLSERENNPYSKYGIGEIWNSNTAEVTGMGGITSAYENPYQVNPDNPASYAFLQRTTFEGGATASSRSVNGTGLNYNTSTMSFAYLNVGMPVGKNGGLCFGLRPFSHSYYTLADTLFGSTIGTAERSYYGSGSLNYAYIGGAAKFKDLSIGFNIGYLFGNYQNNASLIPIDTLAINRSYNSTFSNLSQIGGIYWKIGALYEHKLSDSTYTIRIGGTFTLSQSLTDRYNAYQVSIYNFGDTLVNDTSYNPGLQAGKLTMPMSYSIGAMIAKNGIWGVGIDYAATQWANFKSSVDNNMNLNIASQSNRLSIGGEYSPTPVKIHKHFSHLTYRLGAYYGTDYLSINNTNMPIMGFTFGSSLHFKPSHFSWVNLHTSFDIGKMGTTQNNLIQQTYIRWTIGISFNDKWFIPRKYD